MVTLIMPHIFPPQTRGMFHVNLVCNYFKLRASHHVNFRFFHNYFWNFSHLFDPFLRHLLYVTNDLRLQASAASIDLLLILFSQMMNYSA